MMVNSMDRTVFFADVLGFSTLSRTPGALGAADALSDLALLLSSEDELATLLRSPVWAERYGLSDSIFLVAENPVSACAAAAEFFFNLSYLNHTAETPVLLRGGIALGEAIQIRPIFPESAKFNLVGEAVVRAVRLESDGPKGPRLLLAEEVAQALETSTQAETWLLNRNEQGTAEVLWLLPPDPAQANGIQIGEVCRTAFRLAKKHGAHPAFGYHYRGYLDLAVLSLQRLLATVPEEGAIALKISGLKEEAPALVALLSTPETILFDRIRSLTD
jgi:hypothetical protein